METMHPAGRRTLPPVPRASVDTLLTGGPVVPDETPAERTMELRRRDDHDDPVPTADVVIDPKILAAADEPEHALDDDDPAQRFVSRLRSAAGAFATAAGAETAVVREAVPPARHRRSRCRLVLRYGDGGEADLTFVGAVGRPGTQAWADFDLQIQRWLGTGQQRASEWLVADAEAPDGVAVDVPAWLSAG